VSRNTRNNDTSRSWNRSTQVLIACNNVPLPLIFVNAKDSSIPTRSCATETLLRDSCFRCLVDSKNWPRRFLTPAKLQILGLGTVNAVSRAKLYGHRIPVDRPQTFVSEHKENSPRRGRIARNDSSMEVQRPPDTTILVPWYITYSSRTYVKSSGPRRRDTLIHL
jgi:hypothetical protein